MKSQISQSMNSINNYDNLNYSINRPQIQFSFGMLDVDMFLKNTKQNSEDYMNPGDVSCLKNSNEKNYFFQSHITNFKIFPLVSEDFVDSLLIDEQQFSIQNFSKSQMLEQNLKFEQLGEYQNQTEISAFQTSHESFGEVNISFNTTMIDGSDTNNMEKTFDQSSENPDKLKTEMVNQEYEQKESEVNEYSEENLIGFPKRKREIQLRIILKDRVLKGDLILKTILRKMRKLYLNEFNSSTRYNSTKRHKDDDFLLKCLDDYVKKSQQWEEFSEQFKEDLKFVLGSLFYPKIMKKCFPKAQHKKIDSFHNLVAMFSAKNMKNCLSNNNTCQTLLKHFIETHQETLIQKNKTMSRQQDDYRWGFKYLAKLFVLA